MPKTPIDLKKARMISLSISSSVSQSSLTNCSKLSSKFSISVSVVTNSISLIRFCSKIDSASSKSRSWDKLIRETSPFQYRICWRWYFQSQSWCRPSDPPNVWVSHHGRMVRWKQVQPGSGNIGPFWIWRIEEYRTLLFCFLDNAHWKTKRGIHIGEVFNDSQRFTSVKRANFCPWY